MINWFNMPAEGLSNGGQFEIKELTATENKVYQKDGEVYNKVTVNVEGGGGSSDFTTAEVTLVLTGEGSTPEIRASLIIEGQITCVYNLEEGTNTVVLYENEYITQFDAIQGSYEFKSAVGTGGVSVREETGAFGNKYFALTITGNGTLTVESDWV